ncbi:MAG: hypothetical protein OEZ43_14225 [Gammaproteobacteria bacterium]|nr:hypothetical protein [Gammaproteobacteria bacterium]
METKIFLGALGFSILILVIALNLPLSEPETKDGLPWQIELTEQTSRVFGLTLGTSTLAEAESSLKADGEISLFRKNDNDYTVEAYFDKVELGGLSAKMILVMQVPSQELAQMFQHGVRISKAPSGSNKVSIATEDRHRVRDSAIQSITYLPAVNLDAEQILSRFGKPSQRIPDPHNASEHWLYPQLGLDVTLDAKNREVLQYVSPANFHTIQTPLMVEPLAAE